MTAIAVSPELALVAACCRPRKSRDFDNLVRSTAAAAFDAAALLATARAHRVEGFVEDGLHRCGVALPAAEHALLGTRAAASRLQQLRNAGEEVRVARLLRQAEIEPIFVKGATLAMLAYETLALKTSWDIDMLVAPTEIAAVRNVLSDAGYRLDLPGIDGPHLIERFFARNKETTWVNEARGTTLELHAALVDSTAQFPGLGPRPATQRVELAHGEDVATLADDGLFAYLCVHGTSHRWERLKWLTDVAALLDAHKANVADLVQAAYALGAGHSVDTALSLCGNFLDIDLPESVTARATRNRTAQSLAATSISAMKAVETIEPASMAGLRVEMIKLWVRCCQASGFSGRLSVLMGLLDLSYSAARLAVPDWALRAHGLVWFPMRVVTRPWRRRQSTAGKTASKP